MLRPYFLCQGELLGQLCQAAYETVEEIMLPRSKMKLFDLEWLPLSRLLPRQIRWNPHIQTSHQEAAVTLEANGSR
jgi:hypothetical protein